MTNHLSNETSLYLQQHSQNPVNWYPWCADAFKQAELQKKPIFLSIGYSSCHWCHVMARTCFENPDIADIMNKYFINVKVDREERPDIDCIYMASLHIMNKRGGWPLTAILTSAKLPFYVDTFIPHTSTNNRIGLDRLLILIANKYNNNFNQIEEASNEILNGIKILLGPIQQKYCTLNYNRILQDGLRLLLENYDHENGGFSISPKFPTAYKISFLLECMENSGIYQKPRIIEITENTLYNIRKGGIFDQIGFGVCRYAVDRYWRIPHFEKMLYDQAYLANAYIDAYNYLDDIYYKNIAVEILQYVHEILTDNEGRDGFFSSENSESPDGEEGGFYYFTQKEITNILDPNLQEIAIKFWNIQEEGNFIDERTNMKNTKNILYQTNNNVNKEDIEKCRLLLKSYRDKRMRPTKDEKKLISWNSMILATLAKASRSLNKPEYLLIVYNGYDFISKFYYRENNNLKLRHDKIRFKGILEDYAFYINFLIEIHKTTLNNKFYDEAVELYQTVLKLFSKEDEGIINLYLSEEDDDMIVRPVQTADEAIPSAFSVMLSNSIYLNQVETEGLLKCLAIACQGNTLSYINTLSSINKYIIGRKEVNIYGETIDSEFLNYLQNFQKKSSEIVIKFNKSRDNYIEYNNEIFQNIQEFKSSLKNLNV